VRAAEYLELDGLGLADLVRRRQVTAKEVAIAALEVIDAVNPVVNAVVEVFEDRIAKPDATGEHGPFAGVPLLLKDSGATEPGRKQELGSRLAAGRIATASTYVTDRLKAAGFNIIGRSTLPEFGQSFCTDSVLYGRTPNPWRRDLGVGGSSGGAAVAVATGMVPVAHGSDGGGSIRWPAACCGVVGLKPSRGRVTSGPDGADPLFGLGAEFGLTRSVRDTAALLDALGRPASGDPFVITQPVRPFLEEVGAPVGHLRIGLVVKSWTGWEVRPDAIAAAQRVAERCEGMGHTVEELEFEVEVNTRNRAMWLANMRLSCDRIAKELGRTVDESTLEPVNLEAYRRGRDVPGTAVIEAHASWNALRRKVGQLFERYDLLLTPTTVFGAPPPGDFASSNRDISYDAWECDDEEGSAFTQLFNFAGTPAISIPLEQSPEGLPVGIQFAARFGDEARLIRIAGVLEQAEPWAARVPPIHGVAPPDGRELASA
jgi:amidase